MADWGEGYVTDINYTTGFYQELSPVWLAAAATLLGFRAPPIDKPYTYAELACGQGFGIGLLAAANPLGRFFGFDFNPAQIAHGRRLAEDSGLETIEYHDLSFQELASSADSAWPEFDFIVLHGIYSWVNRDNQAAIIEFVRRFLKPGGLAYISYNCSPGWASMVPLQRLMRLHADSHPARSDVQGREALAFVQRLREGGAAFFNNHSDIAPRLDTAGKLDSHYVAHEYLNRNWTIMGFADMAEDCARAKLNYLGSASLVENLENLSVPTSLLPLLKSETDPTMRQTMLDYASNKGFRRDIYQKGLAPLTLQEHLEAVKRIRLAPLKKDLAGEIKFKTPMGEATGRQDLYEPLIKSLGEGALTLGEIAARPEMAGKSLGDWVEVALLLIQGGFAHPEAAPASTTSARDFNRVVSRSVLNGHHYAFLATPGLGSGIPVGFVDMLAVLVLLDEPEIGEGAFIDAVFGLLQEKGRSLVKDGVVLDTQEAVAPELKSVYASLQGTLGGIWRGIGVLPS